MEIYGMSLHQRIFSDDHCTRIERVPGGWIYIYYLDSERAVSQFVPYHDEFTSTPEHR